MVTVLLLASCATAYDGHELIPVLVPQAEMQKSNEQKIAAAAPDRFAAGDFTARNGVKLAYRLATPAKSNSGKLPLVVMLHGSGQIGTDNRAQLGWLARSWVHPDIQSRWPAYVLVPQVPARSADYVPSKIDVALTSIARPPLAAVIELIELTIAQNAIDADRIYIVGFSMGASAAWNAVVMRPTLFAAALPISGVAPERNFASVIAQTPIMIVHGNADADNLIDSDRAMFAALKAQPNAVVRFKEYAGLGHSVPADMVFASDWREWLFAQRRDTK